MSRRVEIIIWCDMDHGGQQVSAESFQVSIAEKAGVLDLCPQHKAELWAFREATFSGKREQVATKAGSQPTCAICQNRFSTNQGLRTHLMKAHGLSQTAVLGTKCPECSFTSDVPSALAAHLRSHDGKSFIDYAGTAPA